MHSSVVDIDLKLWQFDISYPVKGNLEVIQPVSHCLFLVRVLDIPGCENVYSMTGVSQTLKRQYSTRYRPTHAVARRFVLWVHNRFIKVYGDYH